MREKYLTNYERFDGIEGEEEEDISLERPSHMVVHVVPDSKKRWSHLENLDLFFVRVYQYHQHSGFKCMMLEQVFEQFQIFFIAIFTTFLVTCVDYGVLFRNKNAQEKIAITDCIYSWDEIKSNFTWKICIFLIFAAIFWILRLGRVLSNCFHFWDIKSFFSSALGIEEHEIANVTWEEVKQLVKEVQVEQKMCIHKETLTELDITHRILRFENYYMAMINKNIIPVKMDLPFLGEMIYLTKGLKYNLEFLLFWGPWAPFKNNWHLREEYKRSERRHELAEQLRKRIIYVAIGNFFLSPFIFLWLILYSFFNYAEVLKRQPDILGTRRWSLYGEVYLRHFNELPHELKARLNRGYRAATQYMNSFYSPIMRVIMKHIVFLCGSVLAVLAVLAVIDEDVLQVEHILSIMTAAGLVIMGAKSFIPDENLVWCPELLLRRVLAEVHYLPDSWRGKAHTVKVRKEFSQIFQYKLVHILEELLSPIMTPFILYFQVSRKALDIVDFYRNFTVEVIGVGDICSFAQMDIKRHGSQTWQPDIADLKYYHDDHDIDDLGMRTGGGKTELSLLHFSLTNPNWKPPEESSVFLNALKVQAQKDCTALTTVEEENPLLVTADSLSDNYRIGALSNSRLRAPWIGARNAGLSPRRRHLATSVEKSREGHSSSGVLASLSESHVNLDENLASPLARLQGSYMSHSYITQPHDLAAVDISFSTLYLHELHQRLKAQARYVDDPVAASRRQPHSAEMEKQGAQQQALAGCIASPDEELSSLASPGIFRNSNESQEKTPLLKNT